MTRTKANQNVGERKRYTPILMRTPLNLRARKSGRLAIRRRTIPVGEQITVVGFRQALLRGQRPAMGTVTGTPWLVHELVSEDVGIWMTDLPEEINQIQEMLHTIRPHGRVLVGGLGLGLLPWFLAQQGADVVVVENNPDVIKLCRQPGYRVQEDDITAFLRWHVEPFSYYLLDTWQGTNEATWWEDVMPLRRIIRQRFGVKPYIWCWAEDIMLGQLMATLTTCPAHWYFQYLPMPMSPNMAHSFLHHVGWPAWEKRFGAAVDRATKEIEEREEA